MIGFRKSSRAACAPVDPSAVYRAERHVSVVPDAGMVILLDQKTGRYWRLNSTAGHILTSLESGATVAQTIDALCREYDIALDTATRDVTRHVADLHSRKLIQRVDGAA